MADAAVTLSRLEPSRRCVVSPGNAGAGASFVPRPRRGRPRTAARCPAQIPRVVRAAEQGVVSLEAIPGSVDSASAAAYQFSKRSSRRCSPPRRRGHGVGADNCPPYTLWSPSSQRSDDEHIGAAALSAPPGAPFHLPISAPIWWYAQSGRLQRTADQTSDAWLTSPTGLP